MTASRIALLAMLVLAVVLLAAAVGLNIGKSLAPQPTIAYCSILQETRSETPPCPPPTGVVVLATWGDLTTRATWTGYRWHFRAPVLGQWTTTRPASSWTVIE